MSTEVTSGQTGEKLPLIYYSNIAVDCNGADPVLLSEQAVYINFMLGTMSAVTAARIGYRSREAPRGPCLRPYLYQYTCNKVSLRRHANKYMSVNY